MHLKIPLSSRGLKSSILNPVEEPQLFSSSLTRFHQWLSDIELIQISAMCIFQLLILDKPSFHSLTTHLGLTLSPNLRTPKKTTIFTSIVYEKNKVEERARKSSEHCTPGVRIFIDPYSPRVVTPQECIWNASPLRTLKRGCYSEHMVDEACHCCCLKQIQLLFFFWIVKKNRSIRNFKAIFFCIYVNQAGHDVDSWQQGSVREPNDDGLARCAGMRRRHGRVRSCHGPHEPVVQPTQPELLGQPSCVQQRRYTTDHNAPLSSFFSFPFLNFLFLFLFILSYR